MGEAPKAKPADTRPFWDTIKAEPAAKPAKKPKPSKGKTRFLADSDDDYDGIDLEGEYAALQQVKGIIGEYGGGSAARAARKAEMTAPQVSFDAPMPSSKPANVLVARRKPK